MDLYQNYLETISQFHAWSYFAKTGFVACDNDDAVCGHVLITGFNPGKPHKGRYIPTPSYPNPFKGDDNKYFSRLKSFIPEDMIHQTGYLDLFPFYEEAQKTLLLNIRGNEKMTADVLRVTQTEIERINPSLIIIANKSTYPFWGASDDCVWMGYDFQKVEKDELPAELQARGLDIRIIRGFRQDDLAKHKIIYKTDDAVCRLTGTVAVMHSHSRNLSRTQQLTKSDYRILYDYSKQIKSQF